MKTKWILAFYLAVAMAVSLECDAAAQTTAQVDGTRIKITVPIDVVGLQGETSYIGGKGYESLASIWERAAESLWNQAFREFKYRGCFTLELDVIIHPFAAGDSIAVKADGRYVGSIPGPGVKTHPGHHRIYLLPHSLLGTNVTIVPGAKTPQADVTTPYNQVVQGGWSDSSFVAAHEVGHLMGLGDDYTEEGPLPGREGTFMAGDSPYRIDHQLISRIGDLLAQVSDQELKCTIHARDEAKEKPDKAGTILSNAPERCIAELKEHFKRAQAYAQKIAAQQKAVRSSGSVAHEIAAEMGLQKASLQQVENLFSTELNLSSDEYKALLAKSGHADAYSAEQYQNYRRSMYNQTLNFCIQAYFSITEFRIERNLDFGTDLSFWASVIAIPVETFVEEQGPGVLGQVSFVGIAIPPNDELLASDKKSKDEYDRESRACRTRACFARAKANYCERWQHIFNVWVQKTARRFNLAAKNFEIVSMELVRASVKHILNARQIALKYRKEMHLSDKTVTSGQYSFNEAVQVPETLNSRYRLLVEKITKNRRGHGLSLSHIPAYLDEQQERFERLRQGRETQFQRKDGMAAGCGSAGNNAQARLPTLRRDKLDALLAEINRGLKPDLDTPVKLSSIMAEK